MARRICRARDEGNKQVQAGTGMPIVIDSEELRTQRMPSPNKLHHFCRPRRDTVSFRDAVSLLTSRLLQGSHPYHPPIRAKRCMRGCSNGQAPGAERSSPKMRSRRHSSPHQHWLGGMTPLEMELSGPRVMRAK
jgi:hypothetical protein